MAPDGDFNGCDDVSSIGEVGLLCRKIVAPSLCHERRLDLKPLLGATGILYPIRHGYVIHRTRFEIDRRHQRRFVSTVAVRN